MTGARRVVAWLLVLPLAAIASQTAYLGVLTLAAARALRRGRGGGQPHGPPQTTFAVLVPAHDEEAVIRDTLRSLASLDYPADLVSVHVVADHCSDDTVALARADGVDVLEHEDPEPRGKGPALGWAIERLRERGRRHDAVVVVDADSLVDPAFLRVIDARLGRGDQVVQAYYAVRNAETSTSAGLRAAALAVRHYLRPLGRCEIGASCGLFGNGMAFSAPIADRFRFSAHLTEDAELQMELLLDGVLVAFAPDAIVRAEMPDSFAAARSQHERWERGRADVARRYLPRLVEHLRRPPPGLRRRVVVDAIFDQTTPPFSLLAAATAGCSLAAVLPVRGGVRRLVRAERVVAGAVVVTQIACVGSALRMTAAPRAVYRSLLAAPALVAWKLILLGRVALRPGSVAWTRTARNREDRGAAQELP
jgi:cellulose synthase/poly-beta-1,6-N-acetylglucosamine synthase-like glycosyltransferase